MREASGAKHNVKGDSEHVQEIKSPAHGDSGDRQSSNSARAAASFRALQANLGTTDGSGLYREQYPVEAGDNAYSDEWPFSQVHIAIAVAALFVPAAASASPAPSHSTPGASPASVATANAKSAAGC